MTAITPYPAVKAFAQKRDGLSVHAVEKVRPRADFNGEQSDYHEPPTWICTPVERRKSSHSETNGSDPYWDTPRLKPEFVAQVMGQVYCRDSSGPAAGSTYRHPANLAPMLFDEKI